MKLKEGFEIKESNLEFKLDYEFVNLCNSLLDEELEKLENSIKTEGCRDPLVIWEEEGILLDGHHRLYFCQQNKKSYQIYKKSFPDRFSALLWTWCNDKGRRGSGDSPYYDCETVILKFKNELERRRKWGGDRKSKKFQVDTWDNLNIRQTLARLAHFSEITVHRAEFIMKYADKKIKEKLRKRRPEVQFRALAEKLMMLHPEKQDSEEELDFKETLDKETILNTLNLPQAQSFVKATKEIKNITPEQQKKVAEKLKEKKISDVESMKVELLEEKHKFSEKEKKEKRFEDFLNECRKKTDFLISDYKLILEYKKEFNSDFYNRTFEKWDLLVSIKHLIFYAQKLMKGDDNEEKKEKKLPV